MSDLKTPKIFFLKRKTNIKGGLEKACKTLVHGFCENNFDVHIICKDKPVENNIKTHCLDKKKYFFSYHEILKFEKESIKFLQKQNPDCIFGLDQTSFQTHFRAGNGSHFAYLEHRKKSQGLLKNFSFKINPLHVYTRDWRFGHLEKLDPDKQSTWLKQKFKK